MAEFLPRGDWLKEAQSIAVGRKKRVRHGFEASAAMDVYNNEDSWSAYCHRCHLSGRAMKEHQRVQRAVVEIDRISPVPATCIRLNDATPYEQKLVWDLLIRKGCPPQVIPEEVLWYDRTVRRVLLRSGSLALGRAVDTNRTPKWLPYGEWHGLPMCWATRHGAGAMVLVEDALSSYKVAKAISTFAPESSLAVTATLGTSITDRFLPYCQGRPIICMYDGDPAGLAGFEAMRKRLRVWGHPVIDRRPPKGDPKNNDLASIFANLEDFV